MANSEATSAVSPDVRVIGQPDPVLVTALLGQAKPIRQLNALLERYQAALTALGTPVPDVFSSAAAELEKAKDEIARKHVVLKNTRGDTIRAIVKDMAGVFVNARIEVTHLHPTLFATRDEAPITITERLQVTSLVTYGANVDEFKIELKGIKLLKNGQLGKTAVTVDFTPGLTVRFLD